LTKALQEGCTAYAKGSGCRDKHNSNKSKYANSVIMKQGK